MTARQGQPIRARRKQQGAALMALLALMTTGLLYLLVTGLDAGTLRRKQDEATVAALAQARDALVGNAIAAPISSAGFLQVPDLGVDTLKKEGEAAGNFSGNSTGAIAIGKLPWKTLGTAPPRDGAGECLWYVVSGNFKKDGFTAVNWDTQGQIDVIDGSGALVAADLVALVVAPGPPLDGQDRSLADSSYTQCGGNYDARNHLDPYDPVDAVAGQVNYFAASTNHRVAPDAEHKRFVMTRSAHFNDRFLFVTADQLFPTIIRRSDFATQIGSLLDNAEFQAHLRSVAISPGKGTDHVDCGILTSPDTRALCKNWKEMLLLKQLSAPGSILEDGSPTAVCSRVLFFGGQKAGGQVRLTAADKATAGNYLEGANAAAFPDPLATSGSFSGAGTFSHTSPSADLVRCLP